jgi:tRNA modification GTPase
VAIVRLSGPRSEAILTQVVRRPRPEGIWESHRLYAGQAFSATDHFLDEVLAVLMRAPRSYTREDVAEIHCHGGLVVPGLLLDSCVSRGARLARPGEFTLRAFLSGRIDLGQAESVLALIQAGSTGEARLAAEGLRGALSRRVAALRQDLLEWMAFWEAEFDFGDEVPGLSVQQVADRLKKAREALQGLLAEALEGRNCGEGLLTLLVGPPNAGKSTLWNLLLGEERALVTPYPGTTRDLLEQPLRFGGHYFRLVDSAGLRPGGGPVERMGMDRCRQAVHQAEMLVVVLDSSLPWPEGLEFLSEASREVPTVVILNKRDLPERLGIREVEERLDCFSVVPTCLLRPEEAVPVRAALQDAAKRAGAGRAAGALSVNRRQWQALARAQEHLETLESGLQDGMPWDCLAVDLRMAVSALGEITGENVTDEVLERIFSSFCLGK